MPGGERLRHLSLWLVPRPSFLALDVLEFGCHRTGDVCPCLCWNTRQRPPERKTAPAPPSFVGFLYLSAGSPWMFIALQQGQRPDWWRSGLYNAWLFWSGAFFLLSCALIRRMRGSLTGWWPFLISGGGIRCCWEACCSGFWFTLVLTHHSDPAVAGHPWFRG